MRWTERWLADTNRGVRLVAQHGPARPPAGAVARQYIAHDELLHLIAGAAAVVTAGGPSTVSECLDIGLRPVVVPRVAALGEVVDDHQAAFCRRIAAENLAVVVEDEASLRDALDKAVADPTAFRLGETGWRSRQVAATADRLGALVDDLVEAHGTRPPYRAALDGLQGVIQRGVRHHRNQQETHRFDRR
jgi:UDP-N-acetylglucosamine transferase subunit ALG13